MSQKNLLAGKSNANNINLFLYPLLSFPLFYFAYKYGNPEPLAHDYFQYYHLYQRMDFDAVIAPHNMRFIGAFFVFLLYKLNLFYDTQTVAEQYVAWGFLKQVYFCAVFFNYVCVVVTAYQVQKLIQENLKNRLLGFAGGLLYFLGFGTLFYCLMPLTEAFSILLFTIGLRFYLKKSYRLLVIMLLLVFQREYLLIAFAGIALFDYYFSRSKYQLVSFASACLAFAIYYVLRKTVFYTPHLDYQSQFGYMASQMFSGNRQWGSYFKALVLGGNLLGLYALILIYKWRLKEKIDLRHLLLMVLLFVQVNVITIAGGHGNNTSRYFYLMSPLLIFYIISELEPLYRRWSRSE